MLNPSDAPISSEHVMRTKCRHQPPCPPADHADHSAARTVVRHPEQGWSLLCNGVIVFEDTGELLPDGRCVAPSPLVGAPCGPAR